MTELDLICADPLSIGMIGSLGFFSFSIGSIMFTNTIDTYGRKKVLIVSSLVTPLGLLFMVFSKNLISIYVTIFIIGLSYNTRCSTSYLYWTEFLMHDDRMKIGQYNFMFSGLSFQFAAIWFYLVQDQF